MSRDKIANKDLRDNVISSNNVIPKSLTVDDIKTIGGLDNVSGFTLSYDGISETPTIKDKIDMIQDEINNINAETNLVYEEFEGNGSYVYFVLSNTVNLLKPRLVFYNGQKLREGSSYDYTISGNSITFNFTPVANASIYLLYHKE